MARKNTLAADLARAAAPKPRSRPVYVHLACEARLDRVVRDIAMVRIHRETLVVDVRVRRSSKRRWSFRLEDVLQIVVTRAIKAQCEARLGTGRKEDR